MSWQKKLINIYKKVTSNKAKHVEIEKELIELSGKVKLILTKEYNILLVRMYITDKDGYHFFKVFTPMLDLQTLDNSEKVTNWLLTGLQY